MEPDFGCSNNGGLPFRTLIDGGKDREGEGPRLQCLEECSHLYTRIIFLEIEHEYINIILHVALRSNAMKPVRELFSVSSIAARIHDILGELDDSSADVAIETIIEKFDGSEEQIEKLLSNWGIEKKGAFASPDPVTVWNAFTAAADKLAVELHKEVNEVLEWRGDLKILGRFEFQLGLDSSYKLFYVHYCPRQEIPHEGDILVEKLDDGSYVISVHEGDFLGMADTRKDAVSFIHKHLNDIGYWEDSFEYEISLFERDEQGNLNLMDIEDEHAG